MFNTTITRTSDALDANLSVLLLNGGKEMESLLLDKTGESLMGAAERILSSCAGSTFFVDLDEILNQYLMWFAHLPRIKPFYAVKCNPDPIIVRTLASFPTACFDCASQAEIELVLSCGVPPSNIIFANPMKPAKALRFAMSNNVQTMTFDSIHEVPKIARLAEDAGCDINLLIRLRVDDSHSELPLGEKFGAALADIHTLLGTAKENDLQVIGVSFHVGSGCTSASAYSDAVKMAHSVFVLAEERYDLKMRVLDIGGGFPGYEDSEHISFSDIADALNPVIDEYFPEGCGVDIMAEPGRYFVAKSQLLGVQVLRCKTLEPPVFDHSEEAASEGKEETKRAVRAYTISEGIFGSLKDSVLLNVPFKPHVLRRSSFGGSRHVSSDDELLLSDLYGPNTHSKLDVVARGMYLPDLAVGDWLYYENMGAYTDSLSSVTERTRKVYFCSRPKARS